MLEDAEDPIPHFERALALTRDGNPFHFGAALRHYGAYLVRKGSLAQGMAHLQEARAIFEKLEARGELAKVARILKEYDG